MTRAEWVADRRAQAARSAEPATSSIVPSLRDFTYFLSSQRTEVALVPRLKRADPATGGSWPNLDFATLATALDDSEAAALAVCPSPLFEGAPEDLAVVSTAVTAPVLCDDFVVSDAQVYEARLGGADAVRIPVPELDQADVERLADISVSLHMTPVLDVRTVADLSSAPLRAPHVVGIDSVRPDGFADLEVVREIAAAVPRHLVVVLLSELATLTDAVALRGSVDAVVVGNCLLDADDPLRAASEILG